MRQPLLCVYVLFTLIGSAISVQAQSLLDTPCIAQSLANYLSMYGTDSNAAGCSVGIQNFSEFDFPTHTGTGGFVADSAAQIEVTPAVGGFTFSQIGGMFSVGSGQTAQYQINYFFDIDPTPIAAGASVGMDPPFGNVSIDQYYCADSYFENSSTPATTLCQIPDPSTFSPQDLHVDDTNPPTSWTTGFVSLNPTVMNYANVITTISLDGTNGAAGFDSVTGDSFIGTPEPQAWLLMLGGLLAIIVRKRISHVPS